MLSSAIKNLERTMRILDGIPENIKEQRSATIASFNDIFEDFKDQFAEDKPTLKKITALRESIMGEMNKFCDTILEDVKEDIAVVEE